MNGTSELERNRLVDIEVVKQWLSVKSVNAVKRRVAAGEFPEPLRLSRKCVRWRVADLLDWSASAQAQVPSAQPHPANETSADTRPAKDQRAACSSTTSAPRRSRSR
jgi:predicted DNA-binding transcriptional regulator AlpA